MFGMECVNRANDVVYIKFYTAREKISPVTRPEFIYMFRFMMDITSSMGL